MKVTIIIKRKLLTALFFLGYLSNMAHRTSTIRSVCFWTCTKGQTLTTSNDDYSLHCQCNLQMPKSENFLCFALAKLSGTSVLLKRFEFLELCHDSAECKQVCFCSRSSIVWLYSRFAQAC